MNNHTKAFIKFKVNQLWDRLGVSEHSYCIHPSWLGRCRCGWKLSPETLTWMKQVQDDPNRSVFDPDPEDLLPRD